MKSARKLRAVGSLEGQRLSCSRDCLGRRKDTFMSTKPKVGIVGPRVPQKCLHNLYRVKKKNDALHQNTDPQIGNPNCAIRILMNIYIIYIYI